MSKILVIDNYDSFVYNIVHYLGELREEVTVKRNDQFELNEILEYDKVVLSPGPGIPNEAGKLLEVIQFNNQLENCIPMLGICLGHQAIAEVFGGTLRNFLKYITGLQVKSMLIRTQDYTRISNLNLLLVAITHGLQISNQHRCSKQMLGMKNQM